MSQLITNALTQDELIELQERDPEAFFKRLEEWCNGDYCLCEDNYEDLAMKFIDLAPSKPFETDEQGMIVGSYADRTFPPARESAKHVAGMVGIVVGLVCFYGILGVLGR